MIFYSSRVLFGYEKQTTKIKVFKSGSGGFAEMVEEMSEAKVCVVISLHFSVHMVANFHQYLCF